MRRKFILGAMVLVSLFNLMGCDKAKKVSFDEEKKSYEKARLDVHKFKIDMDNLKLAYWDREIFAYNLDNNGVSDNDNNGVTDKYENKIYKVSEKGKITESKKEPMYLGGNQEGKGLGFEKNKDGIINGIFYYDQEKEIKEKVKSIDYGEKLYGKRSNYGNIGLVENNNDFGFYQIVNGEFEWYSDDAVEEKMKPEFEILNLKEKKVYKVELDAKEYINKVVYLDRFYVVQKNLKVSKLKKVGETFKVDEVINLGEEFGFTDYQETYIEEVNLVGDELVIMGHNYNLEKDEDKLNPSKNFIIKYNLKNREKTIIDLNGQENKLNIKYFNPKTGTGVYTESIGDEGERDYYIGKIVDNKLKLIGRFKLDEPGTDLVFIQEIIEHESGEKIMIKYHASENNQKMENRQKYALIEIEN